MMPTSKTSRLSGSKTWPEADQQIVQRGLPFQRMPITCIRNSVTAENGTCPIGSDT